MSQGSDVRSVQEVEDAVLHAQRALDTADLVVEAAQRAVEATSEYAMLAEARAGQAAAKRALEAARDDALVYVRWRYEETGEKRIADSRLSLRITEKLEYDEKAARAWALKHNVTPVLALDSAAYKKLVKEHGGAYPDEPPGTWVESYALVVAKED